jgi:hypothetical protein
MVARSPTAGHASAHGAFCQCQLPAKVTDIFQQGVYSRVRIASVVGNHLCTLIVFHGFADRMLSHIRAPYFDFQNGGRLADVLIMFTIGLESIIILSQVRPARQLCDHSGGRSRRSHVPESVGTSQCSSQS